MPQSASRGARARVSAAFAAAGGRPAPSNIPTFSYDNLEATLLGRATVVVDRLWQCLTQGELPHAVDAGVVRPADGYPALEMAAGMKPGRTSETEITNADLTGVEVLDAAVTNVVADAAERQGVERWIKT